MKFPDLLHHLLHHPAVKRRKSINGFVNCGKLKARIRPRKYHNIRFYRLLEGHEIDDKNPVRMPRHGINTGWKALIYQAFPDFELRIYDIFTTLSSQTMV